MIRFLGYFQGIYYLITGFWPILNIKSFMIVSGPKTDVWLVKTVGALTISLSLMLLIVGVRKKMNIESRVLIVCICISYALIDINYVLIGKIRSIYLADAFVEIVLLILWIIAFSKPQKDKYPRRR